MPDFYQIGSGLSDTELATASWWIKHKQGLRRGLLVLLIAFSVCAWAYVLWSLLDAYAISYPRESRIPSIIIRDQQSLAILKEEIPAAPQHSDVLVFPDTNDRQDFLVELTNANPTWWAEFTYQFQVGDEKTPERTSYILPNTTRYLTEIGWSGKTAGAGELVLSHLIWHRVNPAEVENNYQAFIDKRWQLDFGTPTYAQNLHVGTQTIGQSQFTMKNNSAYGFWSVDLTIVLSRAGSPVAVTTLNQKEVKPGESRPLTVNWYENVGGADKVEVFPNVNLLDPSSYLPANRL